MSETGNIRRYAVVVSRFNELVTNALRDGAVDTLVQQADAEVEVVSVPGTWEIPVAVKALLDRKDGRPDGVAVLGCILQGQTTHAQLLAGDVSSVLMKLMVDTGVPITWGILTPETAEQALDRAGMKHGNKGRDAAQAMIEMVDLLEQLRS